ncbi:MAG: CBS domain-containing protein [Synergistaceae bacterium]|nr:CBS domain-containing protein [Synergistaceae bacterium]
MRLITSHLNTDFDSLASMVAVQKFYPDAVICPPGTMTRRVRDFLKHYGHLWPIQKPSKIPMDQVTLMVVVDTRSRSRLGPFAALAGRQDVEVCVYDHHPPTMDDIPVSKMFYEALGATVTMIVERLLRAGARISREDATLFSIGIYDDTGALTYDATTDRDIAVLARLRHMGADMSMILTRIESAMPPSERALLDALTENAEESYVSGAKVVLSWADLEEYVEDAALFVHKLKDYYESHVTAVAVRGGRRTHLIVRSAANVLNVKDFLAPYGGSGHVQAGSAKFQEKDPRELLQEVKARLSEAIEPLVRIDSIMTSPVVAMSPEASVAEAYRTMLRFGHQALPVVHEGEVVGMMTRKDLDKAHLHGFDRALVRDFMTEGIIAISSDASVNEAHRLMATYSFERLPVLREGRIIGLVTRADLVRALYQTYRVPGEKSTGKSFLWMEEIGPLLADSCGAETLDLLRRIGKKATDLGMKAYLVGGTVRDILKGEKNVDLDISVEGDAEAFIRNWDEPGCRSAIHGRYKTGTLSFSGGRKVDIATARREFYEYAAAMPEVSSDSLKQDLGRRDFTVNAMAVSLAEDDWGTLIDFYGGRRDLKEGILRVMHNLSFVEDPSRILRGIRLEQRLHMRFEDNTLRLLGNALQGGLMAKLSAFRVRIELELIFRERRPEKIAARMRELEVWEALFSGPRFNATAAKRMKRLQMILPPAKKAGLNFKGLEWLAYVAVFLMDSAAGLQSLVMDRLNLAPAERRILADSIAALPQVKQFFNSKKTFKNSEVYLFLSNYALIPLLCCWAAVERRQTRRWIAHYATFLRPLRGELTGADLLKMSCNSGPWLGSILEGIRLERMDGRISDRDEELEYVRENMLRV